MKSRNMLESFKCAITGIIYGVKSQRNIKIHFIATLMVLILSFILNLSKVELLILVLTIALVIVAEMINTAIEIVVDMIVDTYHPRAKIAKDVAAGAVLVASINALVVGYILFIKNPKTIEIIKKIFI